MSNAFGMEGTFLSRREWLGKMALPAGALAVTGLFESEPAAARKKPAAGPDDGGARIYNIRAYGAKGDKTTIDTADGGGTVLVPGGTFAIGTVELKSNVTLHIAAGGTLLGSGDGKQYHAVEAIPLHGDTTLNDGNWALLFAVKAQNITIEGPGTIDGQGAQFHSPMRGTPPPSGIGGSRRPYHILIYQSQNVTVRDIQLLDCAYHSVRIIESERIHLDSIYIHNRVNGNNDGFHFISTQYVTVSNCIVKCGDDACAMFGSCRYITVINSYFSTRWSVFRFGGGHAGDIAISNCVLHQVYGCPMKFQGDPGSVFENISFSNLVLDDVTGPISISVGKGHRRASGADLPEELPPVTVRNISFSNIHGNVTTNPPRQLQESTLGIGDRPGEGHSAIVLNAIDDAVLQDISFSNVHLTFGGGGTAEEASREVPKTFGEYFALGPIPAYGLYARNARGLSLQDVRFQVSTPDLRPAILFDHVENAVFNGLSVQGNKDAESVLRFIDSKQTLITAPRVLTPSATFLQIEGDANEGIIVEGGDLSRAASPVAFKNGATESSVKLRNVS
ncbi:MAG TPA: glycosyl hydrolase family 28 protein [Terracidiphilus sp.]|nr:glycosyl hydrolase family 28 protein [Terracidiphilus sp.]